MMNISSVLSALAGGALIGLAACLLWLGSGKVLGVSGIVAGAFDPGARDRTWRLVFLMGLCAGGLLLAWAAPSAIGSTPRSLAALAAGGLLVGYGARLGGGCTSGHGVCGIARGSKRSLVATLTFMATAALVVFLERALGGG